MADVPTVQSDELRDVIDDWLIRRLHAAYVDAVNRAAWSEFGAFFLADAVVARHPHFAVEGAFGFYAWYGFGTCVVMVVLAKAAGWVLKRKDTYYDD